MKTYEMMFIIDATRHEGAGVQQVANEVGELITRVGGNMIKLRRMGLRKLAYPIKKKTEGYYYLAYFTIEGPLLTELDRLLRLNDSILRFLITVALPTVVAELPETDEEDDTSGEGTDITESDDEVDEETDEDDFDDDFNDENE